jgi:mono/diheme cytochrome c family protein
VVVREVVARRIRATVRVVRGLLSLSGLRGLRVARWAVVGVMSAGLVVLTAWGTEADATRSRSDAGPLVRQGAHVLAVSGCLACHRLGNQGNDGPGPDLTTVGARLSTAAITRALDQPRQPMPSFAALSPQQHRALVAYLASLKAPSDVIQPAGTPTLPGSTGHAPSVAQRAAIEHTIFVLFRALKHRAYAVACQQYVPGFAALLARGVRTSLHDRSIRTCAQALKAIVIAEGAAHPLAMLRPPHFARITVSGTTATVTLSQPGSTLPSASGFTLAHEADGWKIGASIN